MKKRTIGQFLIFLMIIIFSFTLCGCAVTDLAGQVIETLRSGRDKDDDKEKRVSRRKKNDGEEEDAEADEDENGNKDGEIKDNADEDIDADANVRYGYTNNELCQMALNYYSRHYGYRPGIAEVDSVNGNMVTLHLYDDMGTHTATSAWYEIDRTTGKGTDEIMGGKVDLNR